MTRPVHGRSRGARSRSVMLAAAVVLAAAGAWSAFGTDPARAIDRVRQLGTAGMGAFVLIYALAVIALVPASVLTLAAGAIYGLAAGVPLVFAGAVLGACGAFLLSRHAAGGWVERRLRDYPRFAAIEAAVAAQGFKLVVLLRLSPLVPFSILNYALGVTGVRFRDYVLASVGMLPGTFLYVYSGSVAGEVAGAARGTAESPDLLRWGVLAMGLVATAAATLLISRAARRALDARIADAPTPAARDR